VPSEQKTTEYEERLRAARTEILRDLHEQLEKVRLESEVAVAQARAAAQEKTVAAMASIEDSMQVARTELDGLVGELSAEILKRILPAGAASSQEQAG
jgi:F-type H+-transporting ATPase subunit b